MNSKLALQNLELQVALGVSEKEQSQPQTVFLDLEIIFEKPPLGCSSDSIFDTICYDDLVKKIRHFCQNKSFHLIEYLGAQLLALIKNIIVSPAAINLSIKKNPPITGLSCSIFSIGDSL